MPKAKINAGAKKPRRKITTNQQLSIKAKGKNKSKLPEQTKSNKSLNEVLEVAGESNDMISKLYEVTNCHLQSRKQSSEKLLESLTDVINQIEEDCNVLHDNEQKLDVITSTMMKYTPPTTFKTLKEVYEAFKKESIEMDNNQKLGMQQLADELDQDIEEIKKKVISETKRSGLDALRQSIFQAVQCYF